MNELINIVKNIAFLTIVCIVLACDNKESQKNNTSINSIDIPVQGSMVAELTAPPYVPKPIGERAATKLIVGLEVIEKEGTLADGVRYVYWTFGGTVPGSFIRTRVGDQVEFTLSNHPNNKLPHNIDLHAVTGSGGGASSSFVAPGYQKTFSFKTLNPGLYVYHCASAPVGMHIANGMYGLILVEPVGGLPKVDKEYYIMQGDFYTEGENGEAGLQSFSMKKAINEAADYVVFNGKVGALTGTNAITANVGETVRLFVGNGGPNLTSSFHVIGEIFDNVHIEGGSVINKNVQTTTIPAGGAAIVDFKVDVPGTFLLVDHAIFRAFNKGALGMLNVNGKENKNIYSGVENEGVYTPKEVDLEETEVFINKENSINEEKSLDEKITLGRKVYMKTCFACHQADGLGISKVFPPLAKSDYLNADVKRAIKVLIHGQQGEITVNGEKYNSVMTKQKLTDEEIANVLTYIYNSWENDKNNITIKQVKEVRNSIN